LTSQDRPHHLEWAQVDVSRPNNVDASMAAGAAAGLDVLVNNAAITLVHQFEGVPNEIWEQTVAVNLAGVFYCCRAAVPYLKQKAGAAIVNISSSTALTGGGGGAHSSLRTGRATSTASFSWLMAAVPTNSSTGQSFGPDLIG
jgi:NAD(P)-dependent dehydrogenase (short-subunit alcohol dehydrogenase family)